MTVAPPVPIDQPSSADAPVASPATGLPPAAATKDASLQQPIALRSPTLHRPTTINSEAITKVDPADWDLGQIDAGSAGDKGAKPSRLDEPLPDFSEVEETAWSSQLPMLRPESSETAESLQPLQTVESTPSATIAPQHWQSQQARARRQLLLLGTVGISGCLLAALGFFAFVKMFGTAKSRTTGALAAPGDAVIPPAEQSSPEAVASSGADPTVNANPSTPVSPANQASEDDPAKPHAAIPSGPASKADSAATTDVSSLPIAPSAAEPEDTPPESIAPPLFQLADPSTPSEVGATSPSRESADLQNEPPIEEELPEIFREFRNMFDRSSQNGWDDVGKADRTLDSELTLENSEVTYKEEFFPPAIPVPAWADRSERTFSAIRSQPMNLLQAIGWLNSLGGVGISVDWFSLNLSSIDWKDPTVLQGERTSLGQLLNQLCEAKGLEPVETAGGFLYLRPKKELVAGRLQSDGETAAGALAVGLPSGKDQAIVELLIQWWGIEGCRYENGKLQWSDAAEPHTQAQLLGSLQSIREAVAGLPPTASHGADPYDFARPAAWIEAQRRVRKVIPDDRIIYEERPVIDLLNRSAESSSTNLLLDWPNLWSHGMHPGRLSISVLRGRNFEEVANRYLEDYSLELVPLDSQSILLTTESERRATTRIIALRTDRGVNLDEIKQSLRPMVPRGPDQRSRFRCVPLPGDENIVLVLICLPTLAQLRDGDLVRAFGIDRNVNE